MVKTVLELKDRCLNFASKNLNLRTLLSIPWYGYKQLETEVNKLSKTKVRFTMDLPIPENVPQHKIRPSHENTIKRRAVNNRPVQDTPSSANVVILRIKQMPKTMHKETTIPFTIRM